VYVRNKKCLFQRMFIHGCVSSDYNLSNFCCHYRKKTPGSNPEFSVLDNVLASKIGAIYLVDAASPISNIMKRTSWSQKQMR